MEYFLQFWTNNLIFSWFFSRLTAHELTLNSVQNLEVFPQAPFLDYGNFPCPNGFVIRRKIHTFED